jgi:hypothetical protein
MADNRFDGRKVSTSWDIVLTHARRMGVHFTLDSGRRTMAEQWRLVREKGVWSPSNPHGAARPTPWAPHIRVGLQAHAIDVNSLDGGENRLQRWLAREGLHPRNTVPGESWHLEVGERELRRYAKRVRARQKKAGH